MFLPKQKKFLVITAAQLNVNLRLFEFTNTDKEIRATHKQSGFYFRVVELDMNIVRMKGYALYVYYTPTIYGVAVDPIKETSHSADTWEDVEKSFTKWLNWIKDEFGEQIGRPAIESREDDEVFDNWNDLTDSNPLVDLHPAVQQAVGLRFADKYFSDALLKACTALEKAVQDKANQPPEPTGATLMSKVFSKDKPILVVSANQGEQEGYMFLYRGLAQAIRNHYAHNDPNIDSCRALEWLGFISALFYKLDEAQATGSPLPAG